MSAESEADRAIQLIRQDQEVNGAAVLGEAEAFIRRFCALPTEAAYIAVTLWTVHTHLIARFDSTPRLALLSAEKQSGKTRVLEVLDLLCAGPEILNDATASYMFRRIEAGPVTVLLDEADAIWKRGKSDDVAEALRSIVNSGHRKGGTVGRVEMNGSTGELRRFRVYAPVALAGIGNLPDTILDRAVIVRMRRRAPDEPVEQFRQRTCRPEGVDLGQRLAEWAAANEHRIGEPWPTLPAGVSDRPADVWEPLLAVADVAGGDWPSRARKACVAFVTGATDDTASLGTRLLGDIREVFGDRDRMASAELCQKLAAMDEAPWGDMWGKPLDTRGLAKRLKAYAVKSRDVRIGDRVARGYLREDLGDAWRRYLAPPSATAATSATPLASPVADVAAVALGGGDGAGGSTPTPTEPAEPTELAEAAAATCTACGDLMVIIEPGQTTHPACGAWAP
jgi:hypothetical protein